MRNKVKILFLAANPVDTRTRLRLDKEIREIGQRIRLGTHRSRLELVSEWAVRAGDLQHVLLRHQPDIVHFSGLGHKSEGIVLEDKDGNSRVIDKQAVAKLFSILKDNIRVVLLNACYAKDQAMGLAETIDYTIGMNAAIGDQASIVFAAHFYQSLAFGRSVKEAFDLAVNELSLEGIEGAQAPELLVRNGADASKSPIYDSAATRRRKTKAPASGERNVVVGGHLLGATLIVGDNSTITVPAQPVAAPALEEHERTHSPVAFLTLLFAAITISVITDIARRFLGGDGDWPDIASTFAQPILVILATLAAALTGTSILQPGNSLIEKVARLGTFRKLFMTKKSAVMTGVALVIALGLRLSLPGIAYFINERGLAHYYKDEMSLARACYKRALRLKPSYAQAHYNLATTYEDLQPEEAIKEYLLAIQSDSKLFGAYNNLARLWINRGAYDDALVLLNKAIESSPSDPGIKYSLYKNLAWASYASKRYEQAESLLESAISLQGERGGAAAHCLLALVLKEQNKPGVEQECEDCVRFAPGEEDVEANWLSTAREYLMKGGPQ